MWISTEVSHKATSMLRGKKILKVWWHGITALAETVCKHCSPTA